jgi:lysophospholipase L1-like esterase
LSTLVATSPWSGETLFPRRPFYSWKDVGNSLIIDSAELTSNTQTGQMISNPAGNAPTDYTVDGVLFPNDSDFKYLYYTGAFLQSHNLHNLGFTLCFEVETTALDPVATGAPTAAFTVGGTNLCGLWGGTGATKLNFARRPDEAYFSSDSGNLPVITTRMDIDTGPVVVTGPTHATIHFSVEKLTTGYKASVYIDHTLWYEDTNSTMSDFSLSNLLLNGQAQFFGPANTQSRYKNALLIAGPVDLTLGTGPIHCALVGDSNMSYMLYQGTDSSPNNNPLVTNSDPRVQSAGAALNISGSVYLNSVLCQKGVLPFWDGQYRINGKFSNPGWMVLPNTWANEPNSGLEGIVDDALTASPQPVYWFSNMGGNDAQAYVSGDNSGYPLLSKWVTHVVDVYIQQINRMLAANRFNKVFIISPPRVYNILNNNFGNANDYSQTNITTFNALVAEMGKRLPAALANRGGYIDMYTEWTPINHAAPNLPPQQYPGIHFNAEGYRILANKIGSLVPEVINRRPSNSFLSEVYTSTVVSPYYHIPSGGSATTVPTYVSTTTEEALPVDLTFSFLSQPIPITNPDATSQRLRPVGIWPEGTVITFNVANTGGDTKSLSITLLQGSSAGPSSEMQANLINNTTATTGFSAIAQDELFLLFCTDLTGGLFHITSITII